MEMSDGSIRVRRTIYQMANALDAINCVCDPLEVARTMEKELMAKKRASAATPWGQLVAFLEDMEREGRNASVLVVPDHE